MRCRLISTVPMSDEHMIRRRITELQEYRRQGITTAADAARYDTVKVQRVRHDLNDRTFLPRSLIP